MVRQEKVPFRRPTIGLLTGYIRESGYQAAGWRGVADAAEEHNANLFCFVGGGLGIDLQFSGQRNVAYKLARPDNVDGLIVMGGAIGEYAGPETFRLFLRRYASLPMVNIAMPLPDMPSVLVNNSDGIQQALVHLIEGHGLRRIAFLRGPETNPEAEERYRAYRDTLSKYCIPFDPALVAPGDFLISSGIRAVRLLLEERQTTFEAVVSANDDMALGVLIALQQRGLRVPEDVKVIGFDDVPEAAFSSPPLTTVRQPLYEQGRAAAEILFARLAGSKVLDTAVLSAKLIVRHSCGCRRYQSLPDETASLFPAGHSNSILSALMETVGDLGECLPANWAAELLGNCIVAFRTGEEEPFLRSWDMLLHHVAVPSGINNVSVWNRILALLRSYLQHSFPEKAACSDLWLRAQAMVTEIVHWSCGNRRLQLERQGFDFITNISEPLMTAFDLSVLTDVIAAVLPQLQIQDCYLALYEQPRKGTKRTPSSWAYLALAYHHGVRRRELEGRRFPTRQLLPSEILSSEERFALLLEPLHFRAEQHFGYILFGPLLAAAGLWREALTRQISTALQGAFLLQERQRTEAQLRFERNLLRSLLDHSPDLIWFMDREGRYVATSLSYARYLGVCPEDVIGKTPCDFYPEETARQWLEYAQRLMSGGAQIIGKEEKIRSPITGEERWVSTTAIPRYDENGNIVGALGIARDISEIKKAQQTLAEYSERLEAIVEERTQALRRALQKAQEADRLKSEFIANINHELRTPLANLLLYSQMMRAQPANRTEKNLEIVERELQRLRRLIEDLLDLSCLDSGQMVFHFQLHDLNRLVENVIHDRGSLAEERGISICTELGADLPPVWLDEFMVAQAFSNLLINALHYTSTGGTIWVRTRAERRCGQAGVALSVQDSGPGLLAEDLPHIFERFYRGRAGRESGIGGAGLGLAIVQSIVEQHKGHVEARNAPQGKGAIFTIWLPIAPDESAAPEGKTGIMTS